MKSYFKYLLILPPAILCCIAVILSHEKRLPGTDTIKAAAEFDRRAWLITQGWNAELLSSRPVTVPFIITEDYTDYAALQTRQRLPLAQHLGSHGVIYTYQLENSSLYAELLTADGILIGAHCYQPEQHQLLDMQGTPVISFPGQKSQP